MKMTVGPNDPVGVGKTFEKAAARPSPKKKRSPPFSIRFSANELARLRRDAGALSLAAYIRLKLFCEEDSPPPRKTLTRKKHSPSAELAVLSQLLGVLGKSELAASMRDIAGAAKVGAMPVTPELERELYEACASIEQMRRDLIVALGVKPQGGGA